MKPYAGTSIKREKVPGAGSDRSGGCSGAGGSGAGKTVAVRTDTKLQDKRDSLRKHAITSTSKDLTGMARANPHRKDGASDG